LVRRGGGARVRGSDIAVGKFPTPRVGASASSDWREQLEVLHGLCHAFASARSVDEVARFVGVWVRAATGSDRTTFRLLIPDPVGRLRTVASDEASEGGRKRSARRRILFQAKRPEPVSLKRPGGMTLTILPLVSRGERVGMLEVTAPAQAMEDRQETLLAVASQVAIALRNVRERSLLERQQNPTLSFMELIRDLVTATTPRRAVALAASLCSQQLDVPVAGWAVTPDRSRLELTAVRGLTPQVRRRLQSAMRVIPPWAQQSPHEREGHVTAFSGLTGATGAVTVGDAGDGLLLIARRSPAHEPFVGNVLAVLRGVLRSMAITAQAERRNRELDLSIAWTAHELRRPLLALRFLVLSVLEDEAGRRHREDVQLLQRQLDQVVKSIEGMLHWASEGAPVRRRSFDLVGLVERVVASFRVEQHPGRLRLRSSPPVIVRGDPALLRQTIENLLDNALAYSPPETEVLVSIEADEEGVTLSVEDQGPGIPSAYQEAIFDPFVRVGGGRQPRGGQGLGLFIARKIVEGHGGTLWLEPRRKGAAFRLRVPNVTSRSQRSAS
jgi:signal transduction histidine kinase